MGDKEDSEGLVLLNSYMISSIISPGEQIIPVHMRTIPNAILSITMHMRYKQKHEKNTRTVPGLMLHTSPLAPSPTCSHENPSGKSSNSSHQPGATDDGKESINPPSPLQYLVALLTQEVLGQQLHQASEQQQSARNGIHEPYHQ